MTAVELKSDKASPGRIPEWAYWAFLSLLLLMLIVAAGHWVAENDAEARVKQLVTERLHGVQITSHEINALLDSPFAKLESLRHEASILAGLDDSERALHRITESLQTLASRNPDFKQVRWIDAQGRERVRLQRTGSRLVNIPTADLQDKSSRYYFTDAMKLEPGAIYYSPMDLNVEHGAIEQPRQPTVRFATPVTGSKGDRAGILIINLDARQILEFVTAASQQYRMWLVDEQGNWIQGPSPADEKGLMQGHSARLSTAAPDAWVAIGESPSGNARIGDEQWIWATVRPARGRVPSTVSDSPAVDLPSWKLVSQINADDIADIQAAARGHVFPLVLLAVLSLGLLLALERAHARQRETQVQLRESERLRAAERQAQSAESRAQHLVASNVNGMLNVDADGCITMTNPALDALFGYAADELVGQPVEMLLPETARTGHEIERAEFLRSPTGRLMGEGLELCGRHRDGHELPVEVGLNPIKGTDTFEVTATVIDVSERRRAQRELARYAARQKLLNEELEVKNEDMQELFYSVSHDLRSPLVTVHGYAGVLKKAIHDCDTAKAEDAVGRIQRAVSRLGDMIDDILRLNRTRADALEMETIDTGVLVAEAIEILAGPIEKAAARVEIEQPLPSLHADYPSIKQAMTNLIGNAVKYGCSEPGMPILITGGKDADCTWLSVADNGPGVPAAFHNKVFQLFKQLDPRTEGSGLGLTLVRKVAANHGGRAWVESEPGKGARFCFSVANEYGKNLP